jgi:hypothetical protein
MIHDEYIINIGYDVFIYWKNINNKNKTLDPRIKIVCR